MSSEAQVQLPPEAVLGEVISSAKRLVECATRSPSPSQEPQATEKVLQGRIQDFTSRLTQLEHAVREQTATNTALQSEVSTLRGEAARLSEASQSLEQEHARLASIYAATLRLQESQERQDALDAIQEILSNLIGCEAFAVFELSAENELQLLRAVGVEAQALSRERLITGQAGQVARQGTTWVAPTGRPAPPDHLAACVPLVLGSKVIGLVVLFELLGHKPALDTIDQELFEVLAARAARGLPSPGHSLKPTDCR